MAFVGQKRKFVVWGLSTQSIHHIRQSFFAVKEEITMFKKIAILLLWAGIVVWPAVGYGGDFASLELEYRQIVASKPGTDEALNAQEKLACLYVAWAKQPEADAAYQELLANYSQRAGIAKAVDHVADAYRKIENFQKARQCNQYIVDQWPDADYAVEAQAGVVRASILMGDEIGAQAGMNKLLTSFADSTHVAKAVDDVADDYRKAGQYEKAHHWYQYVVDHWPQDERALKAQKGVVISNIFLGDQTAAHAAINKLLSEFSSHPEIAEVAMEVADEYYDLERYAKCREICDHVIARPSWSGASVGSQEALVKASILIGDLPAAEVAKSKLVADFSQNEDLPEALFQIASLYKTERKYQQARDTYQQAAQQDPQSKYTDKAQLYAAAMNITLLIGSGEELAARAATDKMISDFQNRTLESRDDYPEALYYVGKRFQKAGIYDKAAELYRQLTQQYGQNRDAARARVDLANLDICSLIQRGDNAAAEAAIAQLQVDYAGHNQLVFAVSELAKTYYTKATAMAAAGGPTEQHKDCLHRAAALWETVVSDFPGVDLIPEALCWIGRCYRESGQYQKSIDSYQKVIDLYPDYRYAWDAFYVVGLNYESLAESVDLDESQANPEIKAVFEQILQEYPDCPRAACVRDWLKEHKSE